MQPGASTPIHSTASAAELPSCQLFIVYANACPAAAASGPLGCMTPPAMMITSGMTTTAPTAAPAPPAPLSTAISAAARRTREWFVVGTHCAGVAVVRSHGERMSASHVVAGITGCTPRDAASMLELAACCAAGGPTRRPAGRGPPAHASACPGSTASSAGEYRRYRRQCW